MSGEHGEGIVKGPALEARGLRCSLGGRTVLDGVDVEVPAGALLALVGPSGCGKSTLLRALAGLASLDAGRVQIGGRDVTDLVAERRRVGLVFQDNALFGHLRVDRNVAFGLRHLPRAERAALVAEMLELVGLGRLARRYPHQLSGGEQQRVALARALAPSPEVVLLDEPFGALDESLREDLGWEVKSILERRRTAAVLVTHDRHEALTLGDRVAVMEVGRIVQHGTARDVYRAPASRFVAGFIAVASYLRAADGSEVLVRPHQLRVVEGGPHSVERVEFLGPTHRYTIRTSAGDALVADLGPDAPLAVGARCDVEVLAR
ncbi:MAG: Fe(3+) ions import ATP-binding protein FbpC 2 [Actinomycetota bacterium]